MGRHGKGSTPEPMQPTSPDIWAEDPYYDGPKGNRSVAIWAVALSVFLAGSIGGIGYLFGKDSTDRPPERIYSTITNEATVTAKMTLKGQKKTVTRTPKPKVFTRYVPTSRPTIFVTRTPRPKPGPTKTITRTIRPEPERECFDVDMIEIDCP